MRDASSPPYVEHPPIWPHTGEAWRYPRAWPGTAVALVDDQWRARLMSADYHGPRRLIKKNARCRAEARLYWVEGTLRISVKNVTEIL
jgi:hypothetical protein